MGNIIVLFLQIACLTWQIWHMIRTTSMAFWLLRAPRAGNYFLQAQVLAVITTLRIYRLAQGKSGGLRAKVDCLEQGWNTLVRWQLDSEGYTSQSRLNQPSATSDLLPFRTKIEEILEAHYDYFLWFQCFLKAFNRHDDMEWWHPEDSCGGRWGPFIHFTSTQAAVGRKWSMMKHRKYGGNMGLTWQNKFSCGPMNQNDPPCLSY